MIEKVNFELFFSILNQIFNPQKILDTALYPGLQVWYGSSMMILKTPTPDQITVTNENNNNMNNNIANCEQIRPPCNNIILNTLPSSITTDSTTLMTTQSLNQSISLPLNPIIQTNPPSYKSTNSSLEDFLKNQPTFHVIVPCPHNIVHIACSQECCNQIQRSVTNNHQISLLCSSHTSSHTTDSSRSQSSQNNNNNNISNTEEENIFPSSSSPECSLPSSLSDENVIVCGEDMSLNNSDNNNQNS